MRIEFKYDYHEACCGKLDGALLEGKIEFDEIQGEFYYCDYPERILKKCPFCKEKFERIDYDY